MQCDVAEISINPTLKKKLSRTQNTSINAHLPQENEMEGVHVLLAYTENIGGRLEYSPCT